METQQSFLYWENIDLKIRVNSQGSFMGKKDKEIHVLKNVSGFAKSGECLAIMGSSGAGKSTLLNILADRFKTEKNMSLEGRVSLNREPFSWKKFRNITGFVMQRDLFDENLKVREVLQFAIDLLGKGKTESEKQKILQNLIWDLKLQKSQENLIGGEFQKGISGGEKRRLNIAFELAKNPKIIFLDEPTSGLDSFTSYLIVKLLKEIAKERNMIVVYSIHQPTQEIFQQLDRLLFLKQGETIFFDEAKRLADLYSFAGIQREEELSGIEQFTEILQKSSPETDEKFRSFYLTQETGLPLVQKALENAQKISIETRVEKLGFFSQFFLLFKKEMLQFVRNPISFKIRIFQVISIAVIFILLYWQLEEPVVGSRPSIQNRVGALYFLSVNFLVLYMQNSLATFPKNQLIFVKEYDSGLYDVMPYYLSKVIVEILITSLFPTLFTFLVYFATRLNLAGNCFFVFWGGAVLYIQVATIIGILVGTIVQSPSLAVEVAPAVFVPMMLFSGFTNNTENIWWGIKWLEYLSPVRYFFEYAVTNEFEGRGLGYADPTKSMNFKWGVTTTALLLLALYLGASLLSVVFLYRGAQKGILN